MSKPTFSAGVRWAVTWLHERAKSMNDPHAKGILDSAGFSLGVDHKQKVFADNSADEIDRLTARLEAATVALRKIAASPLLTAYVRIKPIVDEALRQLEAPQAGEGG